MATSLHTTPTTSKGINIAVRLRRLEAKRRNLEHKFYAAPTAYLQEQIFLLEEKIENYSFLLEYIAENAYTEAKLRNVRATHILLDNSYLPIKEIRRDGVLVFWVEGNQSTVKRIAYQQIEGIKTLAEFCAEILPAAEAPRPALTYVLAGCIEVEFS